MSERDPLSSGARVAYAAACVILAAVTVFLVMEAVVRATRQPLDLWVLTGREAGARPESAWGMVDAFCAYQAKPGLRIHGKSVNSYGFVATPEIALQKPPNTIRIAFLGGSSTAGWQGQADEDSWPWATVEILRGRFHEKDLDFINGALWGYTSFESYGRLWSRIRFFSPDIVVLNHGWNEMYYFNRVDEMPRWRVSIDGSWTLDRCDRLVAVYEPLWVDHLIRPSQLLTRLRCRWSKPTGQELGAVGEEGKPIRHGFDERGLEIWRTNLRLFRETAKGMGARLLVIKQPTLVVAGLSPELQARCRYDYHGFDHETHLAAFQGIYRVIDEEIDPADIVDLTGLSGHPEYFADHVHTTPLGDRKIAEAVADALLPHLERP